MAIQPETVIGRKAYWNWRRDFLNARWFTGSEGTVHIPLRGGKETLIDKVDEPLAKKFQWRIRAHTNGGKKFYAEAKRLEDERVCDGQKKSISLHRLIMGFPEGLQVDHVNGDGLDNRRSNLRVATASQNAYNRRYKNKHGYRGLVLLKGCKSRPYAAQIEHGGKNRHIGTFATKEEAALAYNAEAVRVYGEFAILNEVVNGN